VFLNGRFVGPKFFRLSESLLFLVLEYGYAVARQIEQLPVPALFKLSASFSKLFRLVLEPFSFSFFIFLTAFKDFSALSLVRGKDVSAVNLVLFGQSYLFLHPSFEDVKLVCRGLEESVTPPLG